VQVPRSMATSGWSWSRPAALGAEARRRSDLYRNGQAKTLAFMAGVGSPWEKACRVLADRRRFAAEIDKAKAQARLDEATKRVGNPYRNPRAVSQPIPRLPREMIGPRRPVRRAQKHEAAGGLFRVDLMAGIRSFGPFRASPDAVYSRNIIILPSGDGFRPFN